MEPDNEYAGILLGLLDAEPRTPSTVDIKRAVTDGRRRRRSHQVAGYAAAATAAALAIAGASVAIAAVRDGGIRTGTGTVPSVAGGSGAPAVGATSSAPPPPTACSVSPLPVPDGRKMALVTGADPTGRLLLGRSYADNDGGSHQVLIWTDGQPKKVDVPGDDQSLDDVNSRGVAVGDSYYHGAFVAWVYRDGALSKLPGGEGAAARSINEAGVIVGGRGVVPTPGSKPVRWASATSEPVELSLPAGAESGVAIDVDEDGTIVGQVFFPDMVNRPYMWRSDGSGAELVLPSGTTTGYAYAVRDGWATGNALPARPRGSSDGGKRSSSAAPSPHATLKITTVRWNLRTGEAAVFPDLFPDLPMQTTAANRYGWLAGNDDQGRAVFRTIERVLVLPDFAIHRPGGLNNIATTVSDDGRIIAGQGDDTGGTIHAVVWRCR